MVTVKATKLSGDLNLSPVSASTSEQATLEISPGLDSFRQKKPSLT